MRKFKIGLFLLFIFLICAASPTINAQIHTPQVLQAPEPEIYLAANKNNKNLLEISLLYKFPDKFHQTYDPDFFKAEIISPGEFSNYKILYPKGLTKEGIVNYYESALLIIEVDITSVSNGIYDAVIEAGYQLCDESGVCYLPGKKLISSRIEIDRNYEFQAASINILKYILFAFIGGFLLNLMPCVFPLIAIKAVSLTLQSNDDKKKILFSSLSYGAGIIVSLIIIALFLIIFKTSGNSIAWGFYMQNPKFVIFLATVIFIFALSMFDILPIIIPAFVGTVSNFAVAGAEKLRAAPDQSLAKKYAGHFLTGIFAVFIASPCTAPLLGSAIAFALSANTIIILIFFIFIGAGFATPFMLLGFCPKLIKKLPKPGKWNLVLKEVMGFILIGVVIYLISPVIKKYPENAAKIFYFFFILVFAVWFYGKAVYSGISAKIKKLSFFILIIIIICSWFFLVGFIKKDYENGEKHHKTYLEKGYIKQFSIELLTNLNSQNIPVFINIYADWCTTCKINDAIVFSSREIEDFFIKNGIIMLKGDFTEYNSEIAKWMKEFNKAGVPVYAYYHSSKDNSNPVFFPEILTKQAIIKKISDTY
ncbi:MAG: thioredoxin family protein [Spirochaetaceae bacterium]|nr:thioredoxin family protein [Spirochaetaceae bacterium]